MYYCSTPERFYYSTFKYSVFSVSSIFPNSSSKFRSLILDRCTVHPPPRLTKEPGNGLNPRPRGQFPRRRKKYASGPEFTSAIKNKPSFVAILAWPSEGGLDLSIIGSAETSLRGSRFPQGRLSPFAPRNTTPRRPFPELFSPSTSE